MNKKITYIGFALLLATVAVLSFVLINTKVLTNTKSDTNWLMVLHAGEGEITQTGGQAHLTLSNISRNTVFFSDRPDRKYQSIDTHEFVGGWDTTFESSPPNAAMVHGEVGVDTEIVVVELFSPVITGNEISFPIEILGGNYTKGEVYKDVNLFIDLLDDCKKPIECLKEPRRVKQSLEQARELEQSR